MATATRRRDEDRTQDKDSAQNSGAIEYDVIDATTSDAALGATGLPALNSLHPDSIAGLYVINRHPIRVGLNYWRVVVSFGPFAVNPISGSTDIVKVVWEPGLSSEQVDRDYAGNPLISSSGDPFENSSTADFPFGTLSVWKNEAFDLADSLSYLGAVNSDALTLFGSSSLTLAAGEARCLDYRPSADFSDLYASHVVLKVFEFRALLSTSPVISAWDHRMLDQGYRATHTSGQAPGQLCYNGEPVTAPVRLNGLGAPIQSGYKVRKPDGTLVDAVNLASSPLGATLDSRFNTGLYPAVFLVWQRCARMAFSGLI